MTNIDPMDLRMSSRHWELQGHMPSGKELDHVSMYGTDLSYKENAENMYQMFVNLPAEVITRGVFRTEYSDDESNSKGGPLSLLRWILVG
jgi:hypothetical protein